LSQEEGHRSPAGRLGRLHSFLFALMIPTNSLANAVLKKSSLEILEN
jgi:hypothetical protein